MKEPTLSGLLACINERIGASDMEYSPPCSEIDQESVFVGDIAY